MSMLVLYQHQLLINVKLTALSNLAVDVLSVRLFLSWTEFTNIHFTYCKVAGWCKQIDFILLIAWTMFFR